MFEPALERFESGFPLEAGGTSAVKLEGLIVVVAFKAVIPSQLDMLVVSKGRENRKPCDFK